MNLYTEAKSIALEAWQESDGDIDTAQDYIHESCDGHELSIYYGKAIQFCATQDTDAGEDYLEEIGGIVQAGDTFGAIACRIAYATLYCAAMDALHEIVEEAQE